MCALLMPKLHSVSRYSSPRPASTYSNVSRGRSTSLGCAPRALHPYTRCSYGVVSPLLAPRGAWTSLKRGAICVANSYSRSNESTVVLKHPSNEEPVAYLLGVSAGDQAASEVSEQVDKLLKQLQQERQQHQQQQFVVLLHPAAAAAVEGSSSVPVTRSADNEHAVSNKLQQLQEQLSELAAAYEVQLHVLPPQPQRDAHDSATLTLSGGAAEQHQAAGGNHADQPSSSNIGSSSSSSGSVGSLLLSGLGQAGRVAAGAATAAASAVLYAIEGAAAATTAAIVAYEQRGVDVAADLPDTSLRPSTANDWRKYPEQGQLAWQAALTFCALLIQLEKAGYDVVITSGDDDADGFGSDDDDSDDDEGGDSPQDRALRVLMESGDLADIPQGSLVRVIADKDGEILGVEVVNPEDASGGSSLEELCNKLLLEGLTPEEIAKSSLQLQSSVDDDADSQQQKQDGSAAADGEASDGENFTPLGMRVDDSGKVVLLGVGKDGEIRVKERQDKPDSTSSSSGSAAGISLDALLEAGQLPLAPSSSDDVSSYKPDESPTAATDEDSQATELQNNSSGSRISSGSSSDSSSSSSSTSAEGKSSSSGSSNVASQTSETSLADPAESESAAGDIPELLSSSDAINLLKKEFRRRVSSAAQSRDEDDESSATAAAADTSKQASAKDNSEEAAAEDSSSEQQQQQGPSQQDDGDDDADSSDRLAVRSNNPELLAAMLQLERSWISSGGSSSSSAADSQQQTASAAGADGEQLPELLPRPVRPPQPDEVNNSSSSCSADAEDDGSESDGSSKRSGLTPQEAAEVQAIIEDTRSSAAKADAAAAAARVGARRTQQQRQLQRQDSGKQASGKGSRGSKISSSGSKAAGDGADGSGSDSDDDVTGLFEQFERKLEAEGVSLSMDEKVALFVDLYGQDTDDDDDSDDEPADEQSSSDKDTASSAATSSKSSKTTAAAGGLVRSPRSRDSSSSSSKAVTPSGPGWDQLSRMVGPEALSKLPELLKSGNVRLSGLNPLEVSMLLSGLSRLQKGERLDSEEIAVLLRVINEAEITPEGEERDLDEALKRRNRAIRRQQQQSRAVLNRSVSGRANALGFGVNQKDRAYAQDTRSVRVPKAASRSRGEQVKQMLRQLRQQQQYQELQRMQRQALQLARLQLQANMEVDVDQDVVDSSRTVSAAEGAAAAGGAAAAQQAAQTAGVADAGGTAAANKNKQSLSGSWKDALKAVFKKATAEPQPEQQQLSMSSSLGASSSVSVQESLRARSVALVQQLQSELLVVDGPGTGGAASSEASSGSGAARRVVIAVVPVEQLEYVQQAWQKATNV